MDAIDDRERTKRVSQTRQAMNTTCSGRMPGKITLSKLIKACKDIERNMPEKMIERLEISTQTAMLIKHNTIELNLMGVPVYIIPNLKVPYRVIYMKEKINE